MTTMTVRALCLFACCQLGACGGAQQASEGELRQIVGASERAPLVPKHAQFVADPMDRLNMSTDPKPTVLPALVRERTPGTSPTSLALSICDWSGCHSYWWRPPRGGKHRIGETPARSYSGRRLVCAEPGASGALLGVDERGVQSLIYKRTDDVFGDISDAEWVVWSHDLRSPVHQWHVPPAQVGQGVAGGSTAVFSDSRGRLYVGRAQTPLPLREPRVGREPDYLVARPRIVFGHNGELYVTREPVTEHGASLLREGEEFGVRLELPIVTRIWANRDWVLRALAGKGVSWWSLQSSDGKHARAVAFGDVGYCGHPLIGDTALVLKPSTREVLAVSTASDSVYRIADVPLDRFFCVAAEGDLVAVTGARGARNGVAIHSGGRWQWVDLGPADESIIEPFVQDGLVVLSAPEEDHRPGSAGKGAVYVVERGDEEWAITTKVVAANAERRALFGAAVGIHGRRLFASYTVEPPSEEMSYPDVEVCYADF